MSLLPVAEAQARILALGRPVSVETVPLVAAAGRYAAEDVAALRTQPAADLSAMDGYALRFAELPGPFTVAGESAAGGGLGRALAPGEAARIFTGAPVPAGADVVLVQEEAARDGDRLTLNGEGPPRPGAHIRMAGNDFATGHVLIGAGARLTPARIGLAAVGGHGSLAVRRRVRVALISTGDELVPPGAPATGVLLPSSNAPMLAALLGALPVDVTDHGIVPDTLEALTAAFIRAADADIVVTTGGASVGDRDLVRPALAAAGATIDFWRIAMKPGKPLLAGSLGDTVMLGLPGNPVSAFVTATLFLLPLVRAMLGAALPLPVTTRATLGGPLPPTGQRAEYVRATTGPDGVTPLSQQDSAALAGLAMADALIARPPWAGAAAAGDRVEIVDIA
ncbi:gephyrin-like molybdotransferase Glp [Sphingomonas solaris]|uniref:Molybdopterin molybdenumtransferase n=1 Tax=Alterirhizorhabdus solaris TaxID=2529389 RepID=A0A558R149_9SPHN|nr:gephyrin-like molybdotransferase Glp [Sphingomonas solaris]TVV73111.1 molybdopterin molybdotransferase MoeA [Sphingomonas solaris]